MSSIEPTEFVTQKDTNVCLRSPDPSDAGLIISYCKAVLQAGEHFVTQSDEFDFTETQERDWIRRHLDSPVGLVVIAEAGGAMIGLLDFQCGDRRRIRHRGSFSITIHPEYRGEGIGSAMIQTLIDWGAASPCVEKIGLAVFASNTRAIALYKKFGFIEEGRRIRDVKLESGRYVDDVLMYRFVDGPKQIISDR